MSPEKRAAIVAAIIIGLVLIFLVIKFAPKRLKAKRFEKDWQSLQEKCRDKGKWPEALSDADALLDKALKKRRVKGKTMGERMVSAQKIFSDNDAVWFGHKLRKKHQDNPNIELTPALMKKALVGLGKGLRDLGALKRSE
jgi:hypothetical protein